MDNNNIENKLIEIENRILGEEKKSQIFLGLFLFTVAALNILEALIKVLIRYIFAGDTFKTGTLQMYLAFVKLGIIVIAYVYYYNKTNKLFFHSPYVRKLLIIWGVILIPIQLIYDISTVIYNRMLGMIWLILCQTYSAGNDVLYAMFYDSSHGFKYIGLFTAIVVGIMATGVILEKKRLLYVGAFLLTIFIISFAAINMKTMNISVLSLDVGLNFTSLLFHSLTTIGLLIMGIYIINSYSDTKIELG